MNEVSPIQTAFCQRCESLILADAHCTNCSWQRPDLNEKVGIVVRRLTLGGRFSRPYSVPAIHEDLLLTSVETGGGVGGPFSRLAAHNLSSGSQVWTNDMPKGHVTRFLVLAGNLLLVSSENMLTLAKQGNKLMALDPATGELVWQHLVEARNLSAPAVLDQTVFFTTSNGQGVGLDLASGNLRWEVSGIHTSWTYAPPTAGQSAFYVGSRHRNIQQINLDGTLSTFFQAEMESDWFDYPLLYADSVLYAICWNKQLYAIDAGNGELNWTAELDRGGTAPAVIGPHVYVPFKDHQPRTYSLRALNKSTGEIVWQFNSGRHLETPAAALSDELVLIGGNDGILNALDAQAGKLLWSIETDDKVRTPPIVAGNLACVGTRNGKLLVIRWKQDAPAKLESAEVYRAQNEYVLAGTVEALAGNWTRAAQDFEAAGHHFKAAQLYDKGERFQEAGRLYLKTDHFNHAARLFRKTENRSDEAEALLGLKQFERAAQLFSDLGDYQRAAEVYRDAGHLNRSAAQYDLAGQYDQAASIYEQLNKLESAAEMYEKAGANDQAAQMWLQLDRPNKAAGALERFGRYEESVQLLENRGYPDEAAQVWLRQQQPLKAAAVYEKARKWVLAAELYEQTNERDRAAALFMRGGQLRKAARLYATNFQFGKAANLFIQIQDPMSAAQAFEQEQDCQKAAQLYLSLNPPRYEDAGRCYEQMESWPEAAGAYESAGLVDAAIRAWTQANQVKRAADLMYEHGRQEKAAQLLEEAGEPVASAELYAKHGNLPQAVRLYRQAGNDEYALELLAEREAWDQYRELASELHQYERQAEACIALAENAPRTEAYRLYRAAAQAYERAAHQYEEENSSGKTREEIVVLWLEAARLYGLVDPADKRIAWCHQQVNRLRKMPHIVIEVKAQQELVVDEYHRLQVNVKNTGFGDAFDINIKAINDEFDGDMRFTREMVKVLSPDETRLTLFSVKPKTAGSAVPLKMLLTYLCPDDDMVERTMSTEINVLSASSRQLTPSYPIDRPMIDVYEDSGFQPNAVFVLAKKINDHYSIRELHTLARFLNVDWENLPGTTRFEKACELVEYMERRNRIKVLVEKLVEERPVGVDWREGTDSLAPSDEG